MKLISFISMTKQHISLNKKRLYLNDDAVIAVLRGSTRKETFVVHEYTAKLSTTHLSEQQIFFIARALFNAPSKPTMRYQGQSVKIYR
jgi:hypothetical protein